MSKLSLQEFSQVVPDKLDENLPLLVVDHQKDMRMIVAHQLGKLNFRTVIQSSDAMDALSKLRSMKNISAIICSMDLPQMNGIDFLQEMMEDPNIIRPPFCLTMSGVNKDKIMFAIENGVDEILVKPYTLADIVPKLRKAFQIFHNPKNPERMYELAKSLYNEGSYDESETLYRKLHELAPQKARPLVGLARIEVKRKNYEEALTYLKMAEKNNPNYVHLYSVRAEIYIDQNDFLNAIKWYKFGIHLSPLNPNRYKIVADMLLRVYKYKEITEILSSGVEKGVDFAEIYHYLSQAYYFLRDYPNSIKFIKKGLEKKPHNVIYLNQIALAHKECDEFEEATKYYNRVIKIDPDNIQALFNKAIMLAQRKQKEEAIKILERILEKHPEFIKAEHKLNELKGKKFK